MSAAVGFALGGVGFGLAEQVVEAKNAYRAYKVVRLNVEAREIAMMAGNFREPLRTAEKLILMNDKTKDVFIAGLRGTYDPILSKELDQLWEHHGCSK